MKNKKLILGALIITVLAWALSTLIFRPVQQNNQVTSKFENDTIFDNNTVKLKIAGKYLEAEHVSTPEKRQKGLMFREKMEPDRGMFFTFDTTDYYGFWMKNTLIPLDILWVDETFLIVDVKTSFAPCTFEPCETYTPKFPAKYVLELNSGWVSSNQVKIGDKVEIVKE